MMSAGDRVQGTQATVTTSRLLGVRVLVWVPDAAMLHALTWAVAENFTD